MRRILHVGSDSRFVDFLTSYFELVAPRVNVVSRFPRAVANGGPLSLARSGVRYGWELAKIARRARSADLVVAHMLTLPSALAIVAAPRRAVCVWSGWGADYYGGSSGELYGPETAQLVARLGLDRGPVGGLPVRTLTRALTRRAVRRADVFSAPIPDDLAVMQRQFPGFGGMYQQLNYCDVGSFVGSGSGRRGDILLGNSAYPANNHLEAFERLSAMDLGSRRVFTPLAYGDPAYRDAVLERGRALLGDAFDPLVAPLPLEAFQERVSQCGIVMMNHYRQQALGTVGIGLHSGAHVFLSHRNPLHAFLTRSGFDVHDLESATALPPAPVEGAALERTRSALQRIWGSDVVEQNVRVVVDSARAHHHDLWLTGRDAAGQSRAMTWLH